MNIKIIAAVIALTFISSAFTYTYVKGRYAGYAVCKSENAQQTKVRETKNAKIEKSTKRMPEPELDRALRHWLRSSE